MLKLVKITKDYILKEQEPVHALKGLSVNFRRNEFVAILGPSGCGKTTLLNIIGGLDRYTTGDLLIGGVSTKDYKDRDWDTYRNHSIGFVFQSYNLIGHQNILRNVELALTIGGISKKERKERAIEALAKVGLAGLEKKKPNQLSGGQMQRVAIARALVNNPEIILADEPTGALDSETSIQVMDLLKEVAKNCLVIMVTHNPDLADKYANRIVKMKDGELLSDSNPFSDDAEIKEVNRIEKAKEKALEAKPDKKRKEKKSAMSFFTATGLSLSNLISKLSRTILIAIAGSIGIVGVSSVLAVSFGVKNYVNNMQDDMLSEYPITISEESVSISSLMSGLDNWDEKDIPPFNEKDSIGLNSLIQYLMKRYANLTDQLKTNDISEEFIAYIEQLGPDAINSLKYDYSIDPTNNIFTDYTRNHKLPEAEQDKFVTSLNGLTHMYASELKSVEGFSYFSSYISLFTSFMKQLPHNIDFVEAQYDVLAGSAHATDPNDLILVVDEDQAITDMLYGQLGILDETEFLYIAKKALEDSDSSLTPEERTDYSDLYRSSFTFDEILNRNFYYYPDIYQWGEKQYDSVKYTMQIDTANPMVAMLIQSGTLPEEFIQLRVNYDFVYKEDIDVLTGSNSGISMTLVRESEKPAESEPNKILGTWIPKENLFDLLSSGYNLDEEYQEAFKNIGVKYIIEADKVTVQFYGNDETSSYIASLFNAIFVTTAPSFTTKTFEGYMYEVNPDLSSHDYGEKMTMHIKGILKKKKNINFGSLGTGIYYTPAFTAKYMADQVKNDIVSDPNRGIEAHMNGPSKSDNYRAYLNYKYTYHYNEDGEEKSKVTSDIAISLNTDASSSIESMMSLYGFGSDNNTNKGYLRALSGLATKVSEDGKRNEFKPLPRTISIYPRSFKDKTKVTNHIDKWNSDDTITVIVNGVKRELAPDNIVRSEITYNDPVELIITVINTLIIVITVALVAFTSLSLIVSCFMIAVITFISTMERVKEIGVIRSLGGRKKDVSRLFIAECLITGLASGLIGIGVTYILQLIFNIVMLRWNIFGMAALPIWMAAIMILLSITLNVLSGLIPSMKASNQDPVIALRSE